MKFPLFFSFLFYFIPNIDAQKTSIQYSLSSGGMIEISPAMYDSLFKTTVEIKDSTAKRAIDINKIYDLYYAKRDKTFKSFENTPIPDFDAKDTEGYAQSPSRYRGRVLIVHFWLFWSSSFDKEIPELNRLVEKYQQDGLAVLSLTSLPVNDSERQKLKENPLNFPLIDNAYEFTNEFFKMQLMRPCLIIVDKMGNMRYLYDGNLTESQVLAKKPNQISEFVQKIIDLLK